MFANICLAIIECLSQFLYTIFPYTKTCDYNDLLSLCRYTRQTYKRHLFANICLTNANSLSHMVCVSAPSHMSTMTNSLSLHKTYLQMTFVCKYLSYNCRQDLSLSLHLILFQEISFSLSLYLSLPLPPSVPPSVPSSVPPSVPPSVSDLLLSLSN